VALPVGEWAVASQVFYCLHPVDDDMERMRQARPFESEAQQEGVGFFIFNVEDGREDHKEWGR
jgi:hypothetical protein